MLCVSCVLVLLTLIYIYLKSSFLYWKRRNVPHPPPHILFGNIKNSILQRKSLGQEYAEIYKKFPDFPYVGFYKVRQPGIIIRDPEIMHNITIRDFSHFMDNEWSLDEKVDPLLGKDPFFLKGNRWKTTRAYLNSSFTPTKLKAMFHLTLKVSNDMVEFIKNTIEISGNTIETKDLVAKYTVDNVASCIMGLEGKSFENDDATFRKLSRMWSTPSRIHGIKVFTAMIFPSLASIIKVKMIPQQADDYFKNLVCEILEHRKKNTITRKDFIDNMNDLRMKDENYTMEDLTGHVLSFFAEGFETSSLCLGFALYELSRNLHVQEKARSEIKKVIREHDDVFTFETVNQLSYLDCIIYETLRLYPSAMNLVKLCTETYNLPPINGNHQSLKVHKGTPVAFPVYAIQRDPKYFSEPETFDPERFSDDNKLKIVKGSYLPFGEGPRICIGQRFAMTQIKIALVALLSDFDIRLNKKTKTPIEIDERYYMLTNKGGIWLDYFKNCD